MQREQLRYIEDIYFDGIFDKKSHWNLCEVVSETQRRADRRAEGLLDGDKI